MGYLPKDKKRQTILEATLGLVASIGFAGITVRKLAQKMGAATGTIHHHFSSLDDLKLEAFQYHHETTLAKDLQTIAGLPPYQALLELMLPSNFFNRDFESRIWLSAEDEMWRNEKFKKPYSEATLILLEQIERLIQQGIDTGEFKPSLSARECAWKFQVVSWSLSNYAYLGESILNLNTADHIVLTDIRATLGLSADNVDSGGM